MTSGVLSDTSTGCRLTPGVVVLGMGQGEESRQIRETRWVEKVMVMESEIAGC